MSTKSIPFIGKSGKLRREACRVFLTRASSEALEASGEDWDSSLEASSVEDVVGCSTVIVKKKRSGTGVR